MSLGDELRPYMPLLRRYARALTGSQKQGDAIVRMTLEAIVAAPTEFRSDDGLRIDLYRYFHCIWESSFVPEFEDDASEYPLEYAASRRLSQITPINRQILLLNALEGFTLTETATIVGCDEADAKYLLQETIDDIGRETRTTVLIIEDEPLIALELEQIVTSLGHHVVAVASTHEAAVAAFEEYDAGLVLADVQLADRSSGIDAVHDILQRAPVPVIFITAYPERLLTGSRLEPSFLISKPFHANSVRAAISQSLIFNQELAA